MGAFVIDGRAFADELRERVAAEVEELCAGGVRPGLATVLIGGNYEAAVYERRLRRLAEATGCHYVHEALGDDGDRAEALAILGKLNGDPRISGVLVLRPVAPAVAEVDLYRTLDPLKDIEAVHPLNAGLVALGRPRFIPSTPAAAFFLLDRYLQDSGRDPAGFYPGLNVVLVGRSNNVGKPAVWLGLERNATVTSCDRFTSDAGRLAEHTRRADVLIVAAGVPGLITGDHVREGVIAIDVGINPVRDPATGTVHLVGDLDFDSVAAKAEALSPVPGGVGPVTDVWLLHNTVQAARVAAGVARLQPSLEGLGLS